MDPKKLMKITKSNKTEKNYNGIEKSTGFFFKESLQSREIT